MVDRHATMFHYLLEVPVAQRVGRIPADADQITSIEKRIPLKLSMSICPGLAPQFTWPARQRSLMQQNKLMYSMAFLD
jgi:hypothetical protein